MSNTTRLFPERPEDGEVHEHAALDLEGLRLACLACGARLVDADLYRRLRVCPACRFHYHMAARGRIDALADEDTFKETSGWIQSLDPLEFSARVSYRSRVLSDQQRTGLKEAAVTGTCSIGGHPVVIIVLDFGFLGGSMGLVVGEKVALALELAAKKRIPAVTIITSGGARIQEGVLSLMQMAKTVLAADELRAEGVPLISVLGNPATGQVLASFGSLADIIMAEPGAHIGFAPYRTIRETSQKDGGDEPYTSEDFFRHGLVDRLVDREHLTHELASVLDHLSPEFKTEASRKSRVTRPKLNPREPWEMVQLSRRPDRPRARDYIERVLADFVELHGDRLHGDDPAVITGLARLGAEPVVVIGQQKDRPAQPDEDGLNGTGAGLPAEVRGEITPEGFRKAARIVQLAARFKLPVILLVDTPGPMLGLDMERRGLANAISGMINTMLQAEAPTVSVLIGEGGSEAALAFGVADRVLMLQNAIYTPISPENGAASEMRDPQGAKDIARALKLTLLDCLDMRVIDAVVPEPAEGAHASPDEAARMLRRTLMLELIELRDESRSGLVKRRRKKYRKMGEYRGQVRGEVRKELRTWRSAFRIGVRGLRRRDGAAPEMGTEGPAAATTEAPLAAKVDQAPQEEVKKKSATPEDSSKTRAVRIPAAQKADKKARAESPETAEAVSPPEAVTVVAKARRRGRLRALLGRRRRDRGDQKPREEKGKEEKKKKSKEPAASSGDG